MSIAIQQDRLAFKLSLPFHRSGDNVYHFKLVRHSFYTKIAYLNRLANWANFWMTIITMKTRGSIGSLLRNLAEILMVSWVLNHLSDVAKSSLWVCMCSGSACFTLVVQRRNGEFTGCSRFCKIACCEILCRIGYRKLMVWYTVSSCTGAQRGEIISPTPPY